MITLYKNTANPHLEQLMGDLTAIDYVLERIKSHAKIYEKSASYQHDAGGAVLFSLIYLAVMRELKVGNTLLWLNDGQLSCDMQESIFMPLAAPAWQKALLQEVWQVLAIGLEKEVCMMLGELFVACVNTLPTLTKNQMAGAVEMCLGQIRQNLQLLLFSNHDIRPIEWLILLALRLCYVCLTAKLHTSADLHAYLLTTPFFVLMGEQEVCPLVLSVMGEQGFGVWLYRSYYAEKELSLHIKRLQSTHTKPVQNFNQDSLNAEQRQAVLTALTHHFCIITGGPGTGKTFTVARLVMTLIQESQGGQSPTLALSAPTGKAAQRMQESLQLAVDDSNLSLPEAMTIHRLLGMGMDGVPRYHADNPLPFDVVIVDEASMLGVELSQKLFSAVKTGGRLILLGDNHQLSAVEAGMVLGDLCQLDSLKACHQTLIQSRRFSDTSGVGRLARLVNQATPPTLHDLHALMQADDNLTLISSFMGDYRALITPYQAFFVACRKFFKRVPSADDIGALFATLNQYRILCASHRGEFGDNKINTEVSQAHLATYSKLPYLPTWYHGRVIMITKNHYDLGLFNGDMGICLQQQQGFMVYFDGKPLPIATTLLSDESIATAYAITIHKSQGSEFGHVAICLDNHSERLLSRELLYTAITRAKTTISLYANDDTLASAITNPTVRTTGLGLLY